MKTTCKTCAGWGHVTVKMKDLAGRNHDGCGLEGIVACPLCNGKGYITDADRQRIMSVEMLNQIIR